MTPMQSPFLWTPLCWCWCLILLQAVGWEAKINQSLVLWQSKMMVVGIKPWDVAGPLLSQLLKEYAFIISQHCLTCEIIVPFYRSVSLVTHVFLFSIYFSFIQGGGELVGFSFCFTLEKLDCFNELLFINDRYLTTLKWDYTPISVSRRSSFSMLGIFLHLAIWDFQNNGVGVGLGLSLECGLKIKMIGMFEVLE